MFRGILGTALVSLLASGSAAAEVDLSKLPPAAKRQVDFARDIQPILEGACLKCHNAEKAKGKLRLDTREEAIKGGENGPDIVPRASGKSVLIQFTARLVEDSEMPPRGKGDALTPQQIGLLRAWIDQGAQWPEGLTLHERIADLHPSTASLPAPAKQKIDFARSVGGSLQDMADAVNEKFGSDHDKSTILRWMKNAEPFDSNQGDTQQ